MGSFMNQRGSVQGRRELYREPDPPVQRPDRTERLAGCRKGTLRLSLTLHNSLKFSPAVFSFVSPCLSFPSISFAWSVNQIIM
jgi:hypothetical protein